MVLERFSLASIDRARYGYAHTATWPVYVSVVFRKHYGSLVRLRCDGLGTRSARLSVSTKTVRSEFDLRGYKRLDPVGRKLLLNRVTITLLILLLAIIAWNIFVLNNDDGLLVGQILSSDGEPVPSATVILSERSLITRTAIATTQTDESGWFKFFNHQQHALVVEASKEGIGRTTLKEIRLYFRNQNHNLDTPMVLAEKRE